MDFLKKFEEMEKLFDKLNDSRKQSNKTMEEYWNYVLHEIKTAKSNECIILDTPAVKLFKKEQETTDEWKKDATVGTLMEEGSIRKTRNAAKRTIIGISIGNKLLETPPLSDDDKHTRKKVKREQTTVVFKSKMEKKQIEEDKENISSGIDKYPSSSSRMDMFGSQDFIVEEDMGAKVSLITKQLDKKLKMCAVVELQRLDMNTIVNYVKKDETKLTNCNNIKNYVTTFLNTGEDEASNTYLIDKNSSRINIKNDVFKEINPNHFTNENICSVNDVKVNNREKVATLEEKKTILLSTIEKRFLEELDGSGSSFLNAVNQNKIEKYESPQPKLNIPSQNRMKGMVALLENQGVKPADGPSSYVTPQLLKSDLADSENYYIDDLDDLEEDKPKKKIPSWAHKTKRSSIEKLPPCVNRNIVLSYFVCRSKTPDLREFFGGHAYPPKSVRVRTSSAVWKTPPTK